MGHSVAKWEGDTLVVDVSSFTAQTWLDRAGDFHSDALHVVERYTPISRDAFRYEATIEDPKVFTRPWKISMPIYRRLEPNAQLMEFQMPGDGGRDRPWASPQATTGQTVDRKNDEDRRHREECLRGRRRTSVTWMAIRRRSDFPVRSGADAGASVAESGRKQPGLARSHQGMNGL